MSCKTNETDRWDYIQGDSGEKINMYVKVKQSHTGLAGSRRLRLPDFKTIGT